MTETNLTNRENDWNQLVEQEKLLKQTWKTADITDAELDEKEKSLK